MFDETKKPYNFALLILKGFVFRSIGEVFKVVHLNDLGIGEGQRIAPISKMKLGEYQSGQLGQTVNLLSYDFLGSNPSSPTCGSSSVGRAAAFQAAGRGFEPRLPLLLCCSLFVIRCSILRITEGE